MSQGVSCVSGRGSQRFRLWRLGVALVVMFAVGGCVSSTLTPRLANYLDRGNPTSSSGVTFHAPPQLQAAVFVFSDDSETGLAPALSDSLLAILRNRLIQNLQQNLEINAWPIENQKAFLINQDVTPLFKAVERAGKPYLIVARFSSVETESATHLGAQPIMTQMPGLALENVALAELALVSMDSQRIVVQADGRASDSMEELTVPLGESNPSGLDGRDILRGNAAQAALDRALREFQRGWERHVPTR